MATLTGSAEARQLAGLAAATRPQPEHRTELDEPQMLRVVQDLGRVYRERNRALDEVQAAHQDALLCLAFAAELRDNDTGIHIVRMAFLAEALALRLGVPADEARMLRLAAPMHDIGKIGIPDAVLKKPGALSPEERAVMNQHPRMGAAILGQSSIALFRRAAEVALGHHERWDGEGYPAGVAGDQIPLYARIVAVVDYVDALTMDRCYRPAFSDMQAVAMLAAERGKAFDPAIVDAFLGHATEMFALRDAINDKQPGFEQLRGIDLAALLEPLPCR